MKPRLSLPTHLQTAALLGLLVLGLAGCTTTSYVPPSTTEASPQSFVQQTTVSTSRVVPVAMDQAWKNLRAYSAERYKTLSQNRSAGTMTLFVDAFEPSQWINCGMLQTQGGTFDTDTSLLSLLAKQNAINLDMTVDVSISPKSATETTVKVNVQYDLAMNYQTNPTTGALVGGQRYQFDSNGSARISITDPDFSGQCRPTGVAEANLLQAAAGSR